jgi:hypothetical protein
MGCQGIVREIIEESTLPSHIIIAIHCNHFNTYISYSLFVFRNEKKKPSKNHHNISSTVEKKH